MLLIRNAQLLPGIDRLNPKNLHESPHSVSTNFVTSSPQFRAHPPAPINGEIQVDLIHLIENSLVLLAQPNPLIVERRPVERENLTLPPDAHSLVILLHKFSLYRLWSCLYFFLETLARYSAAQSSCTALPSAFSALLSQGLSSKKKYWKHSPKSGFSI